MIVATNLREDMKKKTKRQIKLHKKYLKTWREKKRIENLEIDKVISVLCGDTCYTCNWYMGYARASHGHCKHPYNRVGTEILHSVNRGDYCTRWKSHDQSR